MKKNIKLGYEIKTGKEISIKPSHLIVTGVSQLSGKTTTLESLITRSGLKAIVFKTKIGEKSFIKGTIIPPYFKDRSDWQFIQGLVEATIKERLRTFERAKIIQICKKTGGNSLLDFKKKVDERLGEKINSFEMDILTNLQAYLEIVLPKLQAINFSNELELVNGLNIIDLERFSRDSEVQSLIIRSVAEEVLNNHKGVILVIPEAWKFLPQKRGNPCKLAIEEFIRQGATNNNFIWIDSQDMANVDKVPLKQISNWILGFQSEINEVKHTLNQIPLPTSKKPKSDEIMGLDTGQFILATREQTTKVYVQPLWLDDKTAKKVAEGKLKVSDLDSPKTIAPHKIAIKREPISDKPVIDFTEINRRIDQEFNELRQDFFNKISDIQEQINKTYTEIFEIKNQKPQEVNEETIIQKVLQKMPMQQPQTEHKPQIEINKVVEEVLKKIPMTGIKTYTVAPLEKIKKDFQEEVKNKIIEDIKSLGEDSKKILKFIESQGKAVTNNFIVEKCFFLKGANSSHRGKVANALKPLLDLLLAEKDGKTGNKPRLRTRITELLGNHAATEQEIESLYNHIIMEMLGAEQ